MHKRISGAASKDRPADDRRGAGIPTIVRRSQRRLAAAEEAVAIRRTLAQARPDAFLPGLATSFGALGSILRAAERLPEALAAFHDGIAALAPLFVPVPAAFLGLMTALLQDYRPLSEQLGEPLDEGLLGPIGAVFERLSAGEES